MEDKETNPEICLQDLQAYNEGHLIFKWFDITEYTDYQQIEDEFKEFVKEPRRKLKVYGEMEEYMFCDYSNFPNLGEYPNHEEIDKIIQFYNSNKYPIEAIIAYLEDGCSLDTFEEAYCGEYDSMEDYAHELVDDCYDLEKTMGSLACYFDYESFARDLEMGGDYSFIDGYVFNNNV